MENSIVTTINKKGDKNKCENYRGIAVLGFASSVRKSSKNQEKEVEEHTGFQKYPIYSPYNTRKRKKLARNQKINLLFVDLKKTHDSGPLVKFWKKIPISISK